MKFKTGEIIVCIKNVKHNKHSAFNINVGEKYECLGYSRITDSKLFIHMTKSVFSFVLWNEDYFESLKYSRKLKLQKLNNQVIQSERNNFINNHNNIYNSK